MIGVSGRPRSPEKTMIVSRSRRQCRGFRRSLGSERRGRIVHVLVDRRRADPARSQVDGSLVVGLLLAVVGGDQVGMLPFPARLALRELLLELARVEQDELG